MPFDPTITQKVRTALLEAGHSDLVVEQIGAQFRELEHQLYDARRDIKLLQDAERSRVTDSGVHRIVKAEFNRGAVDWMKWGTRAAVLAAGGLLVKLAWKGLHAP